MELHEAYKLVIADLREQAHKCAIASQKAKLAYQGVKLGESGDLADSEHDYLMAQSSQEAIEELAR